MVRWRTVSIRSELVEEIEGILRTGRYSSVSEFVSESIRLRLDGVSPVRDRSKVLSKRILYTREHMWAEMITTENVRVGLSNHICICKDLRRLAPNVHTVAIGEKIGQMEPFGAVLTRFAHVDLYAPVSGRLKRLNRLVLDEPWIISEDPYEMGWIAEIEPTNLEEEIKGLLDSKQYLLACIEQCLDCPKKNCWQARRLDEWV